MDRQIKAIVNQSVTPSIIFIWNNSPIGIKIEDDYGINIVVSNSSENLGVWARFIFALNSFSEYVAVFDDDTIPGSRWFENCLNHIDERKLLGTRGLRFASKKSYFPYTEYGWNNPNKKLTQVDIVGHAWFFHHKLLSYYFSEFHNKYDFQNAGEDIHFSYSIQIFGCKTCVPPHPKTNLDLWGSLPEFGNSIGSDENSISLSKGANDKFDKALAHYIQKGFSIHLNNKLLPNIVLKNDYRSNGFVLKLINKVPILKFFLKKVILILSKLGIYI